MAAALRIERCLTCTAPQADDVRHALGNGALEEERNKTPSGLPLTCCRVRLAGAMPTSQPMRDGRRPRYLP
jgi:hypothetical protein